MKKLDKLILKTFFGPFTLTFIVVEFVLLTQFMLRYIEELVGKGIGIEVYAELFFYFGLNLVPMALPLSIMLASLIAYGNLGEHRELTAIKSSGVSLLRTILPIFLLVIGFSIFSYFFNNHIVPEANLKAYSLMYDIRQKKPALDIKEGTFYNGIPGYTIKVNKKYPDGESLKDIIIYNKVDNHGNSDVIIADSGKMYTILNERYLIFELFNGKNYKEYYDKPEQQISTTKFIRNYFEHSKMVFDLSSFNLSRTKSDLFKGNKYMHNQNDLKALSDTMLMEVEKVRTNVAANISSFFLYYNVDSTLSKVEKNSSLDTSAFFMARFMNPEFKKYREVIDISQIKEKKAVAIARALNQARGIKSYTSSYSDRLKSLKRESNGFMIEYHKKYTQALACLIMFLIAAPIGCIIKKGGLGIPVIISISNFIFYYIISESTIKMSKEDVITVEAALWFPNLALLPIGLFFIIQARNDTGLFDAEYWIHLFKKRKKENA
jgi:lipopolysaccharide export system permease protein